MFDYEISGDSQHLEEERKKNSLKPQFSPFSFILEYLNVQENREQTYNNLTSWLYASGVTFPKMSCNYGAFQDITTKDNQ